MRYAILALGLLVSSGAFAQTSPDTPEPGMRSYPGWVPSTHEASPADTETYDLVVVDKNGLPVITKNLNERECKFMMHRAKGEPATDEEIADAARDQADIAKEQADERSEFMKIKACPKQEDFVSALTRGDGSFYVEDKNHKAITPVPDSNGELCRVPNWPGEFTLYNGQFRESVPFFDSPSLVNISSNVKADCVRP